MTTLRKQFKDLLLHLDQEDLDFLLEIANKYSWCDRHKNGKHCKFIDFACDICDMNVIMSVKRESFKICFMP